MDKPAKKPLRISALSVPLFMHGGLEVNEQWSAFPDEPTERQRAALRDYHGRFIRIHPEDRAELAKHRLVSVDEHTKLEELPAKKPDAKKADEQKKVDEQKKADEKK